MVQNKRSRLILDATYVTYLGTEHINGTVRVLFKTRLIFSRINGPIISLGWSRANYIIALPRWSLFFSMTISSCLYIYIYIYIYIYLENSLRKILALIG